MRRRFLLLRGEVRRRLSAGAAAMMDLTNGFKRDSALLSEAPSTEVMLMVGSGVETFSVTRTYD